MEVTMRFLVVGALLVLTSLACNSDKSPFIPTPESDRDAQLISLILGQTIRPNQTLALSVARELDVIRETYREEIPEVDQGPLPPWAENAIVLWMTEGAADSVRQGTYTAWNDLNEAEGATLQSVSVSNPRATLKFDDWIHPRLMAEKYADLPGVVRTGASGFGGDWPNLYPFQHEYGRSYLFRKATGDCLSGCIENEFWYFRHANHGIEYVGHWDRGKEAEPEWWAEAKQNWDYFFRW